MYDFHKTRTKDSLKEFKHEYLRRGRPEYLKYIKRKTGEEAMITQSKTEPLIQKCKELEEKCRTFEALARLSIPIKKMRLIDSKDSNILFEAIMHFLEQRGSDNAMMDKATNDYIQQLREIKICESIAQNRPVLIDGANPTIIITPTFGGKAASLGDFSTDNDTAKAFVLKNPAPTHSEYIGKREQLYSGDNCFGEDCLDSFSMKSSDFGTNLLDFGQQLDEDSHHYHHHDSIF